MDNKTKAEVEKVAYLNWEKRGRPQNDPAGKINDYLAALESVVNKNDKLLVQKPPVAPATPAPTTQAADGNGSNPIETLHLQTAGGTNVQSLIAETKRDKKKKRQTVG